MPTALPPSRIVPWPALRRALWLRFRLALVNTRMAWLPATDLQAVANGRRWLALSAEMYRLLDLPEPEGVAQLREVLTRPLPDGSTLLDRGSRGP